MTKQHPGEVRNRQPHREPRRRFLRNYVFLVLTLSLAGNFPAKASALSSADGPEAVMGSTRRDFGEVFAGEELEQNFPVRNNGTKPLELAQRSTLGTRSTTPAYSVTAAVWRPSDNLLIRTATARRAAPS